MRAFGIPIRNRDTLALAFAFIVVLMTGILAFLARSAVAGSNEQAEVTRRVVEKTDALLSSLKDAETSQRGFLLTGEQKYLEPYEEARTEIPALVDELSRLDATLGRSAEQERVGRLRPLVSAELTELAGAIDLRQRSGLEPALREVRSDRGKALMDQIRNICRDIQQNTFGLAQTQAEKARLAGRWAGSVGIVGSASVLVLLGIATITVRREKSRRELLIEALRQSRDWFQTTLASIGDCVISTDANGKITLMNPVAESLTGWTQDQALGRFLEEVFVIGNATTGAPAENPVATVLREGRVIGLANHTRLTAKDGRIIPIDDSAAPIRHGGGHVAGVVLVFRDVTERYRAQKDLENAEQHYRFLFENNPLPMWVYDVETLGFLGVNHATVEQYGYSREEFAELTLKDIRPTEDVSALLADVRTSHGLHRDGPWRHRRKNGVIFFVEIIAHPIEFMGRNARMVIANDVTDRVRAERAVLDASERLKTIVNTAPLAIWTFDPEGRIMSWNRTAGDLLGWSDDEVIGNQLSVFPEKDFGGHGTNLSEFDQRSAKQDGTPIGTSLETICRCKDGRLLPVTLWSAPLSDHESRDIGRLVVVADISKRKHDEQALAQTEAGFRLLFENNPQPMWVFDEETYRFLEVNHAAVSQYGYSREEFLQRRAPEMRAPQESTPFRPAVSVGAPQNVGLRRHRRKNGTLIEVEIVAHRLEFNGVPAILSVLTDVTEKRVLEEELRQSQKLEAIGRLAGGVAHDFNNLLTVIIGYTDMLRAAIGQGSREREAINEVGLAAERASSLTRQLLAFSRRQVLTPEALNLNRSIQKIQPMLSRLIGENIQIITDLEEGLWSVSADPGQVDQIIVNLAVNARDVMESGGKLTIQTSNAILTGEYSSGHLGVTPGAYVRMVVSDTGHGMDAETRAHIFEPFFTTKDARRGTGLGLAMVYGIIKQSGGDIWVYSEVGIGTSINIYLPRLTAAEEKIEQAPARAPQQGTESVLLVEDEESVRKLITELLEVAGYHVRAVANAEEALQICSDPNIAIDLLLTDLVLSKGTGWEIASKALQARPGLKMLFMSGYSEGAVFGGRSLEKGVNFIQKPFSGTDLRSKIREVIEARSVNRNV
jgi:two-component system, cell cycle sensor histidine kinase and response regulator CckA